MKKSGHIPHSGNKPGKRPNNKPGKTSKPHIVHSPSMLQMNVPNGLAGGSSIEPTASLESIYDKGVKGTMCMFTNFFKKKPVAVSGAVTKYYVGVGINAYKTSPLNGCVNDIEDVFKLLVDSYGFQQGDNMRLLCDSRATRKAIMERLNWLVSVAKAGDVCVFDYSGHGTYLPNRASSGEVDGVDECLVPYDFDWSHDHLILDDDLGKIADSLSAKGAIPIFIIDACHSGTILRDMLQARKTKKVLNRMLPPPIDIAARIKRGIKRGTLAKSIENNNSAILIAGCKEDQTSADAYFSGRYNGALTYCLIKALKGNKNMTYLQLKEALTYELEKGGFAQIPQVVGPDNLLNKKVFDF